MYKYFLLIAIGMSVAHTTLSQTYTLWVDGLCGMCQDRIEQAAQSVPGVSNAHWNMESKMLTVNIASLSDTLQLHHAMVNAGHDTRLFQTPNEVYENLHTCCKYRQTESPQEEQAHEHEHEHEHEHGHEDEHEHQHGENVIHGTIRLVENGDTTTAPGASLRWLHTDIGTVSDAEGHFEIEKDRKARDLVISYVGFGTDTVRITKRRELDVFLQQGVQLREITLQYRRKSTEFSMISAAKAQYISSDELKKAACCNLSESFETTPAIDASVTDAVTGTRRIEMLGLAGPNVQIMRENQPYVRGLAGLQGLAFIPGHWIQGMHLNTGAGSVVNGFESITGQINVALHQPQNPGPQYSFNVYGNQGSRWEFNATTRHAVGKRWHTGSMIHLRHQKVRNDHNDDGFVDMPTNQSAYALHRWKYGHPNGWQGQMGVVGIYSDNIGGQMSFRRPEATADTWGSRMTHRRAELWLKTGKVFDSALNSSMGFQFLTHYTDQDAQFGQRRFDADAWSLYANFIFESDLSQDGPHQIRTGASIQYDKMKEQVVNQQFERAEWVPGTYVEYSYVPDERWTIVTGLRADYHNLFGAFITPRFHARFSPDPSTAIRLSGGRGQRTASIFVENIAALASNRSIEIRGGGSDLDPELPYGLQAEVAWNFGLNITKEFPLSTGRTLLLNGDAYYTFFENQIVADYDHHAQQLLLYNLAGDSKAYTLQFQADADWSERFSMRIAYRYNDVHTQFTRGYLQRPLISPHRAFLNVAYTLPTWKWDGTLSWQSTKRIPYTGDNPTEYQLSEASPDFILFNAQLTKVFSETWEVYVGGENIFNFKQERPILAADEPTSPYFDASLIWGPVFGRNVYAGLRWAF